MEKPEICPHCGYCPTCGRSRYHPPFTWTWTGNTTTLPLSGNPNTYDSGEPQCSH